MATAVALAGYALASHLLMVHAADRAWAVAALFGPLLLAIAAAGWRQRQWPLLLACAALLLLLVATWARGGVADMRLLYVLQHAGIHMALALTFGVTLRRGSTPLITALAQSVHRHVTPALRHYTRRLTLAWTVYFMAMVALSLLLYWLAPWPVWSLFGNLITPLAAGAFFVGEHLLRYRLHPEFERLTLRAATAAWRSRAAAP
ncbi:MAG: hypothetical protein ABIQ87_06425 [Rubrivivax sp.]